MDVIIIHGVGVIYAPVYIGKFKEVSLNLPLIIAACFLRRSWPARGMSSLKHFSIASFGTLESASIISGCNYFKNIPIKYLSGNYVFFV